MRLEDFFFLTSFSSLDFRFLSSHLILTKQRRVWKVELQDIVRAIQKDSVKIGCVLVFQVDVLHWEGGVDELLVEPLESPTEK